MTSSLRTRLESKRRRRVVFPVQITDPSEALEELAAARRRLTLLEFTDRPEDDDEMVAARAAVDEAQAAHDEHYAHVEFQSIPSADLEALMAAHRKPDNPEETDYEAIAAPLAAASAIDEDLRDEAWWAEQLARHEWTLGEKGKLASALIDINYRSPDPAVPKD